MQQFATTPQELFNSFWRHRSLILALAKRDVVSRYRGSVIGLLWSFFNPVLMLLVYTFVFGVVFSARWNVGGDSRTEFALVLFSGLIIFNLFAECVTRAPQLILTNANYVKKVIFPLEILPWVLLGSALFHAAISLGVWLMFYLLFFGLPGLNIVFLPIIVVPFLLLLIGFSWLLASIGVYLRDTGQVIGIATTAVLFLSPIFYPVSALPERYQYLLYLNPLTLVVEQTRDVLIWGLAPNWEFVAIYATMTLFVAWCGFVWFQKTRRGFADVL
jgi:lipopolysaccharide transport system permease protein